MTDTYIPGVLLGCAIGDAMGMPFESRGCEIHPALKGWKGDFVPGTHHKLEAGRWTDDTEMSLELAKSLLAYREFNGMTTANHYVAWAQGNPTGMGGTTRDALNELNEAMQAWPSDKEIWRRFGKEFEDPDMVGSGTAMRAAPLGVFYAEQPEMLRKVCRADAYITHAHEEAFAASLAIAATVAGIIRFHPPSTPGAFYPWKWVAEFLNRQLMVVSGTLTAKAVRMATQLVQEGCTEEEFANDIAGRFGCAWQCTSTAIFCAFRGWQSFESGIQMAVQLGGDTDTRGAMTGAILGAKFGLQGIPAYFRKAVYQGDALTEMDAELAKGPGPV